MVLSANARLGRYEIRSLIGEGGMGEVYLARDPKIGRDVAIKVLPPQFSGDAERLARFEQEARAAGALNHPNVVAAIVASVTPAARASRVDVVCALRAE